MLLVPPPLPGEPPRSLENSLGASAEQAKITTTEVRAQDCRVMERIDTVPEGDQKRDRASTSSSCNSALIGKDSPYFVPSPPLELSVVDVKSPKTRLNKERCSDDYMTNSQLRKQRTSPRWPRCSYSQRRRTRRTAHTLPCEEERCSASVVLDIEFAVRQRRAVRRVGAGTSAL